ncbi:solute carrier family 35 member D3-like [Micropterus salmoides]|uniref:solute carrier family 35 member D3-like n=1 Tax=Micropterus salmoides TaxID=27706 RepID=UPI0018EDCC8D|nr:solute carrier family 35 member D3-like [Micropterus salmoides]
MDMFKRRFLGISVAVAYGVSTGCLNIVMKLLVSNYHFDFLMLLQLLTSSTTALILEILRRLGKVKIPPFSIQLAKIAPRLPAPRSLGTSLHPSLLATCLDSSRLAWFQPVSRLFQPRSHLQRHPPEGDVALAISQTLEFGPVCIISTLQSTLTLWSMRGLSLPMFVVFKRCLPLLTLVIGMCVLRNGMPSSGVVISVIITTAGAALAGAGDVTGDTFGYITGVLVVIIHASYLVLIQKSSLDGEYGPLTAQYAIAVIASPTFSLCDSLSLPLFQALLVCSVISKDIISMWSYEGWKDPHVPAFFVLCILFTITMNFTTLQCTYINSAVTTSFVSMLKSIATITIGMVAFSEVAPTGLFIGGVVVNTVGSIIYCIIKYFETKKKRMHKDLEEAGKDGAFPCEPYQEKRPLNGIGPAAGIRSCPGNPKLKGALSSDRMVDAASAGLAEGKLWTGNGGKGDGEAGVNSCVMMEKEMHEMQREHLQSLNTTSSQSVIDSYVGVWRSIRHLQLMKNESLIQKL